jgi:hypothetical protein
VVEGGVMAGLKKERKLADLPCHARKVSLVILFNKPRVTVICMWALSYQPHLIIEDVSAQKFKIA